MRKGPGRTIRFSTGALPQRKFGGVLLSHNPSVAVPSALSGLASGFGMGPGVSLTLKPPKHYETHVVSQNRRVDAQHLRRQVLGLLVPVNSTTHYCASISGLSTQWSVGGLNPHGVGYLILEQASRLDAFRGYPFRTWPTSHAPVGTTGTPEVRPSRSSRTRDSLPQVSYARGG